MTIIGPRPQLSTESFNPSPPPSAPSPQVTRLSVDSKQQGATEGSPGIQFAKTSQTRLASTARAMQKATQALGEELVALEAHLRSEAADEDESGPLIKRNPITARFANLLEKTSDATNFRLSLGKANPTGQVVDQLTEKLLGKDTHTLNEQGARFQYAELIDQHKLKMKLLLLLSYHPDLAEVLGNAGKTPGAAALGHLASSSPRADVTMHAIDDMCAQVLAARQAGQSSQDIAVALKKATSRLEASGGIVGRASTRLKENPGNNEEVDARKVGHWIAQGRTIETNQAVRYGFINKSPEVVTTEDQPLLDSLMKVADFDTTKVLANTPLLLRECADREQLSEVTEARLRRELIVNQPFEATDPRRAGEARTNDAETDPLLSTAPSGQTTVNLEQVPMLLALKYVICGQEHLVDQKVLSVLDDARTVEAFSSHDPEFAAQVSHALRNPDNAASMCLHRKLVAAELMNTFLEGGSALETAQDVAPYAGAGMLMEAIKHVIPGGALKSVITEAFLGGADLGDNGMGCMAELRSQAKTVKGIDVGGIADLYEKTFGHKGSNMMTMLAHLALLGAGASDPDSKLAPVAKAMGFKKPTGDLASITETQMQSFLTGSAVSIGMTSIYSAAGALASNPAVLALLGAGAIMGTSISPAIGFGMLHAELALAVKVRLQDKTLQAPQHLDMDDHAAVTAFCSKEAMNQLMMQTGNGAGNIAFLLAPLASSAKLLGFAVPQELIDALLEPFMPGMENIARVVAMDSHEGSKRDAIRKIKETCINQAAMGNTAPITLDEFDARTLSALDKIAAEWSLAIASPFVKLLGRSDYPHLVPLPNQVEAGDAVH